MNDPILPDLPEGFYLATGDGEGSRVYEHCGGKWRNEHGARCIDPRCMMWNRYTLHSIPALLSAVSERDALKVRLVKLGDDAREADRVRLLLHESRHRERECHVRVVMAEAIIRDVRTAIRGHAPDCAIAAVLAKAKS